MQGVSEVGLRDPEAIDTPLETTIQAHLVSGRVRLGAIRGMGMGLLGDHGDGIEVTFHAWIEQETGYVARMVFEGVPPPHFRRWEMLYLFDHNMMKASGIPKPHPDAMAPLVTDLADGQASSPGPESGVSYAPIVVTDPVIRVAPIAPLHREESVDVDTIEPSDALIDQENASSTVESQGGVEHRAVPNPPVVERRDGLNPEWTMYVLPVDGYSIEFPAGWEVSALPDDGGSLLTGNDPAGHARWEIRRFAGTHTIFNPLQDRVDALESGGQDEVENVDVSIDTASHVPEARLRYKTVDGETVDEMLVVRGDAGQRGLAYSLLAILPPANETVRETDAEGTAISESFTLPGMETFGQ